MGGSFRSATAVLPGRGGAGRPDGRMPHTSGAHPGIRTPYRPADQTGPHQGADARFRPLPRSGWFFLLEPMCADMETPLIAQRQGRPGAGQKSVRTFGADQVEAHDHAAAALAGRCSGVAALARQAFLASSRPRLEVSGSPSEEAMDSSRMRRATSRLTGAGGRLPEPSHSLL